jgi:hypothetical protein
MNLQRVSIQEVRVVLVLIATGYLVDALLDQGNQRVASFPLSPFRHLLGYGLTHPEFRIRLCQPSEPAIRSEASTIEGGLQASSAGVSKRILDVAQSAIEGTSFATVSLKGTRP